MRLFRAIKRYGLIGAVLRAPSRIWRRLRSWYYQTIGSEAVPSVYGVLMQANWGDHTFQLCFNGIYGRFLSNYLRQQQQPFVFLDVGANQGLYSIVAAQNPCCVQVYALEPVRATYALLEKNVEINGLSGKITPMRLGLSAADGSADIVINPHHSGVASLHGGVGGQTETIELVSGRSLVSMIGFAGVPLIVKVDVEGHESVVLSQLAMSEMGKRINAVFYEVSGRSNPEALQQVLSDAGLVHSEVVGSGAHYDVLATRPIAV